MRLSPSLVVTWGPGTTGQLPFDNQTAPTWTNFFSTAESDQIGIQIDASGIASANLFMQVSWTGANEAGDPVSVQLVPESFETPVGATGIFGYTNAGLGQQFALYAKTWGPIPPGTKCTIWLPAAAQYFQIGIRPDASPGVSDVCNVVVMLAALED